MRTKVRFATSKAIIKAYDIFASFSAENVGHFFCQQMRRGTPEASPRGFHDLFQPPFAEPLTFPVILEAIDELAVSAPSPIYAVLSVRSEPL